MKIQIRTLTLLLAAITLFAIIVSCSSGIDDDQTAAPAPDTQPTARPTIAPTATPTNTPGPTPTPAATATPTPIPTATPTPQPPDSHVQEMGRLFADKGIDFSTLFVSSVGRSQWDTSALGCPEPGTYHDTADAPYTGMIYSISNGSVEWEYHSSEDDSLVVRCSEITPSNATPINLAQQANLHDATKLTLMRRDFSTGEFLVRREMTPHDMARVVDILDQESAISPHTPCNTVFRLDFETPRGTSQVEFICQDNYKAFDIYWNGLHGNAPIFGDIIGPYLTGDPIPTLPTAAP